MTDKKKCVSCNENHELEMFSFKNQKENIRHNKCKNCQRLYCKKRYLLLKQTYKDKAKVNNEKYKERNREILSSYKNAIPCKDCNNFYPPYVMDFDHLPNYEKFKNLSRMKNSSYSVETIRKEIEKCDLVCANCHRIRTWKRTQKAQ